MSRSGGRGRDASRRFHTLPSRLPFPPGVTPSQTGLTAVAEPGQRRTHNLPRNVIPGLGLGLSAASPAQQGSPVILPSGSWYPTSQLPPADVSKPAAADGAGGSRASVSEEGEVSEGTDDDVYKNNAPPGRPVLTKSLMGPPGSIQRGSSRLATRGRGINAHAQPGPANASRQRSGSYSPYLSPREVNNAHSSPGHNKRALLGQPPRSLTNTLASASDLPRASPANGGLVEASTETTLRLAKQKAKDAILQLWPLNIRYDDYLKEGIDGGILGTLFKDLELDFVEDATPPQQPKAQDIAMAEAPAPQKGQDAPAAKTKLVPSEMTKEEVSKAADKSEERKDRIARLLAAKGSKATASTPSNPTASISTPASVKVAQSSQKAQSEKSKLLQQKMEALRKSRESLLRPPSQQPEKATASLEAGKPSDPDAAANVIASAESRDFLDRLSETGKPSPSVPTTRQPSQSSDSLSQHNRPALSLADRYAKTLSRPFGQTASRPLLIDVSDDDDDDAEMDMDSPIRPFGDRPDTPSKKATVPSAATNVNSRQGLTPTPADTPTRSLGPGSGEDLASMNKRIEAMKRKIAQAEARKRIKLSAQASPAASQQNDNSRCVSVEAGSIPSALSPEGNRTPLTVNSTAAKSASVPHDRPLRPINPVRSRSGARQRRSVTASERLPLIEARRKEQLLKLKMLQSEMAKIERDIAEGMQEEDELKQDLIDSGSGSEHQAGALPEVGPMGSAQTSGVGSVSHSPVISEEISDRNNDKTEISGSNPAELAWDGADTTADDESAKTSTMATQATTVADRTGEPMVGPAHESVEADGDVMMEDLDDGTGQDLEDSSDNYEPPDANSSEGNELSTRPVESAPAAVQGELPPAASRAKGSALNVPTTSKGDGRGKEETVPQMKPAKRGQQSLGGTSDATNGHFVPYETPLQCFRAYRFHPEFGKRVDGGLRSLTYSNKIDVQKQVCPDELAGQPCPRDGQCDYQHFESMKAPDDQILLQLGAAGHYQEAQKQQYIAGLRELLTDLRNRKVKDFNTISQGIIDYRARFLGDVSKILPLGSVTL